MSFSCLWWRAEFEQFEAKIQDLREQMMSTGSPGSPKAGQKRSMFVRYQRQ